MNNTKKYDATQASEWKQLPEEIVREEIIQFLGWKRIEVTAKVIRDENGVQQYNLYKPDGKDGDLVPEWKLEIYMNIFVEEENETSDENDESNETEQSVGDIWVKGNADSGEAITDNMNGQEEEQFDPTIPNFMCYVDEIIFTWNKKQIIKQSGLIINEEDSQLAWVIACDDDIPNELKQEVTSLFDNIKDKYKFGENILEGNFIKFKPLMKLIDNYKIDTIGEYLDKLFELP